MASKVELTEKILAACIAKGVDGPADIDNLNHDELTQVLKSLNALDSQGDDAVDQGGDPGDEPDVEPANVATGPTIAEGRGICNTVRGTLVGGDSVSVADFRDDKASFDAHVKAGNINLNE